MNRKPLLYCGLAALLVAACLYGAQVAGYLDLAVYPIAPGNPKANFARLFLTSSGLGCKTSTGASCLDAGVTMPVTSADIATPAAPAAGSTKWYTKEGKLCNLDSSGTEWCMGGVQVPLTLTPTSLDSYANPQGSGVRTGQITVTSPASGANGAATCGTGSWTVFKSSTCDSLIGGGGLASINPWGGIAIGTGYIVLFDFITPRKSSEFALVTNYGYAATATWKWQGSADAAAWSDLTAASAWSTGSAPLTTLWPVTTNLGTYRYYRFIGVSGSLSTTMGAGEGPYIYFNFKIDSPTNTSPAFSTSGLATFTGNVNSAAAVHTTPTRVGTMAAIPASCAAGELYFASDATAGKNLYFCTAANTWTATP